MKFINLMSRVAIAPMKSATDSIQEKKLRKISEKRTKVEIGTAKRFASIK